MKLNKSFLLVLLLGTAALAVPSFSFAQDDNSALEDSLFGASDDSSDEGEDNSSVDEDALFGGSDNNGSSTDEDALFGGSDSSGSEDDLFGGSSGLVSEISATDVVASDELLTNETVDIGGRISSSVKLTYDPDAENAEDAFKSGLDNLGARIFLDARPSTDLRGFIKGDIDYDTDDGLSYDLREMFIDTDINNQVFIRAGKQTINWGVGRFFSPANLINIETIDPENPDAELAGPVAAKVQYPIGNNNLTGYALVDDIENGNPIALASRYEFLAGGSEYTVGGVYQFDNPWSLMSTVSTNIGDVAVFAEAVLEGNVNKKFLVLDDTSLLGVSARTSDDLYFSSTIGASYNYSNDESDFSIFAFGQYYFNGLGYADISIAKDYQQAIGALLAQGQISVADLFNRGQHYGALSISSPDFLKSKLTPSIFWIGNLNDASGRINLGLSYRGIDNITPSFSYSYGYGDTGTEYSPFGADQSMSLSVSLGVNF